MSKATQVLASRTVYFVEVEANNGGWVRVGFGLGFPAIGWPSAKLAFQHAPQRRRFQVVKETTVLKQTVTTDVVG